MPLFFIFMIFLLQSAMADAAVIVYSSRKSDYVTPIFDRFTEKTGIKVTVHSDKAASLLSRLSLEKMASPADLLITADIANVMQAKKLNLLKSVDDESLLAAVPEDFRGSERDWFALSKRYRLFFKRKTVDPINLQNYEDIISANAPFLVLVRSANNVYNQSLIAHMIARNGREATKIWAKSIVDQMARPPQGGDTDQLKALAAGVGDYALANHYYYMRMKYSDDPRLRGIADQIEPIISNQKGGADRLKGIHMNVSTMALLQSSKNSSDAIKLMVFLTETETQEAYAIAQYEYPIRQNVNTALLDEIFAGIQHDDMPFETIANAVIDASILANEVGWK